MFFIYNYLFIRQNFFPKTLLARFMLIITIPTLIGQFIAIHIFYERHWYNVIQHTSEIIVKEIESLIEDKNYTNIQFEEQVYNNLTFYYISNSSLSQKSTLNREEFEILENILTTKLPYPISINLDKDNKIEVFLQINNGILKVQIPSKPLLNPTTDIFVMWIISLTVILLTTSLIFSKNQIKSILELTKVAESYGRGEKIDNYKPSGAMEIRQAGIAFLKMRDRIERQVTKRTQMLAMISHDLKTPLTRMKLQIELMDDSEEKEELKYDIESMQQMIASYLDFSRGEGGESFVYIDINKWIKEYIKNEWSKANIQLKTQKREILVKIKPHSFKRAINNLISNATKYSTKIKISIYSTTQEDVNIIIEDNGIGINDIEKQKVLKPFYRGDKSRSLDNTTNVGLGLAITKEIIHGHYGTIILGDSAELKGLLVKISLPQTKDRSQ